MDLKPSHKHVCPRCNLIWEHPDNCGDGVKGGCKACHTCPRCGFEKISWFQKDTYVIYRGTRKPHIIFVTNHKFNKTISQMLEGLK